MGPKERRVFQPTVLETKQELLAALRSGDLRVSKYNCLNENQKLFVELTVFGGYTGEQAVRVIDPSLSNPRIVATRMLADPTLMDVVEELTVAKDVRFRTEAMSARDTALAKLMYIMKTSKDEQTQLIAAKTILEKTNDYMKNAGKKEKEDSVASVTYHIQVDQMTVNATSDKKNPIVIPFEDETEAFEEAAEKEREVLNPANGMPYTLMFEGVNNYYEEAASETVVQDGAERGSEPVPEVLAGSAGTEGLDDSSDDSGRVLDGADSGR